MSAPAVTVLLPVFNGAKHLRAAIESVRRQSFVDFELLVIDDGSTDETAEILGAGADPRIRVVRNDANRGLVFSLNRGLDEARGEWIARQDADDISAPGRLAAQMAFARGNPAVPLVGSDAWLVNETGRWAGRWRTGGHADLVAWDLCFRTPFAHGSALFRRRIARERLGGYRDLPACEDLDLWARVAAEFPVVTLRQPLVKYRLHGGSIMASAHRDSARQAAVRSVLRAHVMAVAPGLDAASGGILAQAWTRDGGAEDWDAYFEALERLKPGFFRGRRTAPGFARILIDQHYTLFYRARRAGRAGEFLRALARRDRASFARLPWLRIAAAAFRG
jgi:glycosyltransferase involved in cell wall biosynthesis